MESTEKELEWVERLAQTLVEHQLYKLEFETEDVALTIRAKQRVAAPAVPVTPALVADQDADVEEADVVLIRSKDVGIFSIDGDLKPGVDISVGQKLGRVEAVSVEHDLIADDAGTLVEVLVSDGDPVEYGQPLFVLSESE